MVHALGYSNFKALEADLGMHFEDTATATGTYDGYYRTYFNGKPLVSIHEYFTADEQLAVAVVRYGYSEKQFLQYTLDPLSPTRVIPAKSGYGVPERRPLYNLREVIAAKDWVFVVEGEKAADALNHHGLVATTSLGGANAAGKTIWNELGGKKVCIWPDNDDPGAVYAKTVRDMLALIPTAPACVVTLNVGELGLAPKDDAYDWLKKLTGVPSAEIKASVLLLPESCSTVSATQDKPTPLAIGYNEFSNTEVPRKEPLVYGLIARGDMAMIFGPPGCGKTWLTIGLSLSVASGRNFVGYGTTKARVLYIDGEMQVDKMQKRMNIMRRSIGASIEEVDKNFAIMSKAYMMITDGPKLNSLTTDEGKLLVEKAAEDRDLIVFDNVSSLWRMDDNNEEEWANTNEWLIKLRSSGKSIIIVHHPNKSGESQRGTSKRSDQMDLILMLRPSEQQVYATETLVEVHFEKARDLEPAQKKPMLVRIAAREAKISSEPLMASV